MPKGLMGFQKGHPRFNNYSFPKGNIPWNKGKQIPEMCGKNHPNWKGGKDITTQGYVRLQMNGKAILEHRFIMMNKIGRKLKKSECVHHINGIKTDNIIENLKIVTRKQHIKLHPRPFRGGSEWRICINCNKKFKTFLSNNNVFCSQKCFWNKKKGNKIKTTYKRKVE